MRPVTLGNAVLALAMGSVGQGQSATIKPLHRFADTGKSPSQYSLGSQPYAELVQATDGNFYGTTLYGGAGLCPNNNEGGYTGCGTIFRMTPQGKVTVLYSFPYDSATGTGPNGAYPTAGLIQGKDGYLYGVAQDGGLGGHGCNAGGCGTVFRLSLAGTFTVLHQFCGGGSSVANCASLEGGRPAGHLVQAPDGTLYGTTQQGGVSNSGTVYSVSLAGAVRTLHFFQQDSSVDGATPASPLLLGPDGTTFYGTTVFGGANGGGTVFSVKGSALTVLHSFDGTGDSDADASSEPEAALIFGANGLLYGTTAFGDGGKLFHLATDGSGFTLAYAFNATGPFGGSEPITALVLGGDGLMYGSTLSGDAVFKFNPANSAMKPVASFGTATGAQSRGALVEGKDKFLYGTTSLYGGDNARGPDGGSTFRIAPALSH